MKKAFFIIVLITISMNALVYADDVFLENGGQHTGAIVEENDEAITLQTKEGTMILLKKDIVHIQKNDDFKIKEKPKQGFIKSISKFFKKMPQNNWFVLRKPFLVFHARLFDFLERQALYQVITNRAGVIQFKRSNPKSYFFAVYMVLLMLITFIGNFIYVRIRRIVNRIRGVRERY